LLSCVSTSARPPGGALGAPEAQEVVDALTKEGQQKNRRCDIIVVPSVEEMIDLKSLASR
jgi:chemotaxis protein MotB